MTAVIGDIHGCFFTLNELVNKIRSKYSRIKIYSVGDLVDRGNFSLEVLDFIREQGIKFTHGNHDYMFYYFIHKPASELGEAWVYNGYESTLDSYNNRFSKIEEHLNLIIHAPIIIDLPDCFISHAGISKYYESKLPKNFLSGTAMLENILRSDLDKTHGILWTRGELLNIGKLQVVGHTRREEVMFDMYRNVVYIDTSAYSGNKLSAVIIDNNKLLEVISVETKPKDIE